MTQAVARETKKKIYLKDYEPPHYWVDQTHLDFDLYEDHAIVQATSHFHRREGVSSAQPMLLDGQNMELISVKVDGQPVRYDLGEKSLTLLDVPESGELEIVTRIEPQKNTALEGLYRSGKMFCTQCEAHGFQRITYFVDRPDNMATYTTTIRADKNQYPVLLSNGNLIDQGDLSAGRHFVTWQDPFKKPSYLFALVAGDLECLRDEFITCSGRKVDLRIYVDPGHIERSHFAMESLKKSMRWDEERFGREYDLDIFMIVAADAFNSGAMENKGLNIFNSMLILADKDTATDATHETIEAVIGHEYFHNWSGNRVTCRDWFQLSLKEGLTVYRDQEFTSDMRSPLVTRINDVQGLRAHQFKEDDGPNAHPVRPESCYSVNNFYTSTIYEKGSELIRMMATLMGREKFRQGLDLYFQKFDGMAVTTEDFVLCMEEVSGMDLSQFRLWYTQAGTPKVEVKSHFNLEQGLYSLHFKQSLRPTEGQDHKAPMHIPLRLGLLDKNGHDLDLDNINPQGMERTNKDVFHLNQSEQTLTFKVAEEPIPSLLRHFSAPVKLEYAYSEKDLFLLMKHDSDGFNKWEASQRIWIQFLLGLEKSLRQEPSRPSQIEPQMIEAYRAKLKLKQTGGDLLYAAKLLQLPDYNYISQFIEPLNPQTLYMAIRSLEEQLGQSCQAEWRDLYKQMSQKTIYKMDQVSQGRRTLRNQAMSFLIAAQDKTAIECVEEHYFKADNMTDRVGALAAVRDLVGHEVREKIYKDFYQKWHKDSVVINTWLSLEASAHHEDALKRVQQMSQLEIFDFNNPNKVRSLLGSFMHNNILGFHREDGASYAYLTNCILDLDKKNPQIAARMVSAFNVWKRLEPHRSALMKKELERLVASPQLSANTYELASRALTES